MDQVPWMGTVLEVPGWGDVTLTFFSTALICLRLAGGIALFAHGLPRRPHFGARCGVLAGMALLATLALLVAALCVGEVSPAVSYLLQFAAFSVVLAACVGSVLFLFDTSAWVALFCVTAGYTTQNLATGTSELVASLLREVGINPSDPLVYHLNDLICLAVVYAVCHLLLARRIDHEGLSQMENRGMLLMMPVVSLAIIGLDVLIKSLTSEGLALGYVVALRQFHGMACVATLWIEYQMLYRVRVEQDRATTERLLAERERQFSLSRETIEAINIKCHDLRHQIRSLADGDAAVDRAALDDLAREVSIYDSVLSTGNEALDTILTEKGLVCERRGITLTCIANGTALGFMAPADLYAFFGNALDNAIEAAGALEDPTRRTISVVVRRTMGAASIHVENYFAGELRFSTDGLPATTKADRTAHGFGVRSMRQIAERYGGTFSADAADGVFRLDVIIPDET